MKSKYQQIPIEHIDFDTENPRIKLALRKYGDSLNEQRIIFALRTATSDSASTSSYRSLKDSIRASYGITVPIVICPHGQRFICYDGNTRLAIYKELQTENPQGKWNSINCLVLDDPSNRDIETIRVTAHLVGARAWPAYEKARYLHHLRNTEYMDHDQLIAQCGGSRKSIDRQIDAFHDMNKYYREAVSDDAFKVDRFSGFVELQKQGIKEAILDAGYDLEHFGEWIRDGKIFRLADVRKLPIVLGDEEATEVFVNGGVRSIEKALKVAERNRHPDVFPSQLKVSVEKANLHVLATALLSRIKQLPRQEFVALRDRSDEKAEDVLRDLNELAEQIQDLLTDVAK